MIAQSTEVVRKGSILFLMTVAAATISRVILLAAAGAAAPRLFLYGILSWTLYIASHYICTGTCIDSPANTVKAPQRNTLMLGVGSSLMVIAFPIGIVSVHAANNLLLFGSVAMFLHGYMIGHYAITGKLL